MGILDVLNITNQDQLQEYASEGTVDGEPIPFEPYCPFPYTNEGWDTLVADPDNFNLTMNDCSLKLGDALGAGYLVKCGVYVFINFVCLLFCVAFLAIFIQKRKASKIPTRNLR
jgi:hypothetical protein